MTQYYVSGFVTGRYIFNFGAPLFVRAGYGMTATAIHEVGHQLGLNHPFDGYDDERKTSFLAYGQYYFVNVGNESNSVMSYLDVNADFSQFDRDNMNRFPVASYINQANSVLAHVVQSPRAGEATALLLAADGSARSALNLLDAADYPGAAAAAMRAYDAVVNAATAIGVKVEPAAYTADYRSLGRSPMFVDGVSYPSIPR